jgi:LysR family cys regulon transcriptional activator
MKLQQLRYLVEVARRGLNVSEAAEALYTSQPGISKQIRLLEEELGVTVFERGGKRLTAITEPGRAVLEIAERMLRDAENIRRVGEEYAGGDSGSLVIATTHTQARYALPAVVKNFVDRHPEGSPVAAPGTSDADRRVDAARRGGHRHRHRSARPVSTAGDAAVLPVGALCDRSRRASDPRRKAGVAGALSRWPLITYDSAFAGRSRINKAFELAQLTPNVVLTAIDADVIKTYVGLGLGLGIIARMAFDPVRDTGLQAMPAEHLFGSNTTRIGLRRGTHIRRYEYDFIELFASHLTKKAVDMAMAGARPDDEYQL